MSADLGIIELLTEVGEDNVRVQNIGAWLAQLARRGIIAPKTMELPGGHTLHLRGTADRKVSHGNQNLAYTARAA